MIKPNNGGPAFPCGETWYNTEKKINEPVGPTGMTLRDYFAAAALQGILASKASSNSVDWAPASSYRLADAMLAAREGKGGAK